MVQKVNSNFHSQQKEHNPFTFVRPLGSGNSNVGEMGIHSFYVSKIPVLNHSCNFIPFIRLNFKSGIHCMWVFVLAYVVHAAERSCLSF